jgi:hypothetical protein
MLNAKKHIPTEIALRAAERVKNKTNALPCNEFIWRGPIRTTGTFSSRASSLKEARELMTGRLTTCCVLITLSVSIPVFAFAEDHIDDEALRVALRPEKQHLSATGRPDRSPKLARFSVVDARPGGQGLGEHGTHLGLGL